MLKSKILPRCLALWMISLVTFPAISSASQPINIDGLTLKLQLEIRRMMLRGNVPSAAVALVYKDRIIWNGAYGCSNLWSRTLADKETVYLFGSIFKTMSMYALLQQMEEGKFRLDQRVNDYLSKFKIRGEDPSNPVTFRHLMAHVSGLPADFGPHQV
ncbi:MAG: beta-lactamase family protein, partial [Candidatus Aminicenantes bacterium]|nr:beta-lactamase family protein [Candidatus Aminicenantes bacterium]